MISSASHEKWIGRPFKAGDCVIGLIVGFKDEQMGHVIVDTGSYLGLFPTKWVCPRCKAEKEELQAWTRCILCGCELEPHSSFPGDST